MDNTKIGKLICRMRKEKGLTQLQLAEKLHVSDKAVSKWERGLGCPDISLISSLSETFGINIKSILDGGLQTNETEVGNMTKTLFYYCHECGNLTISCGKSEISCCGKKLEPLEAKECDEKHKLNIEKCDDELYITMPHEMTKEHYITFLAYLSYDKMHVVKLYPEQDFALRFPEMYGGSFYFYCTKHGFFKV